MVSTCCAFNCTYRHNKEYAIGLFRFPKQSDRRQAWVNAIRRKNWQPTNGTRICGLHFQTGRPSRDKDHPDYVPNVFSYTKEKVKSVEQFREIMREREKERPKIVTLDKSSSEEPDYILPTIPTEQESFLTQGNSEDASDSESITPVEESMEENSTGYEPLEKKEISEDTRKNLLHEIIITDDVAPQIIMSLSEYENIVSKLKAENERLQGELRYSKIDNMVDIALEMSTLREEIRTLKGKLHQAQFSTILLSDTKKLYFYTGMHDLDTFNNMVQSCKGLIDTAFAISEETQLLIVLVKLKMKFHDDDLAVRFNVSKGTIRRVLETWLPILSLDSK